MQRLGGNGGGRMYKKALVNNSLLYFVHAPPQTDLDPVNPRLPKAPYKGAPREHSSVYYYWWAFLQLNEGYIECCAKGGQGPFADVYSDFRDVRGDDFVEWWKQRGAYCFAEPQQREYVRVLDAPPETHDPENGALISVPLAADIEETLKSLRYELKPRFDKYRENHGHFSCARYKVFAKPVLSSLDQILRVKKAKLTYPDMKHRELAEKAGLVMWDVQDVEKINTMVSRNLKKADRLIANVVKGRFPDFSDPNKTKAHQKRG